MSTYLCFSITAISLIANCESYTVCKKPACRVLAEEVRNIMDEKVNPCTDFYKYACGKWIKNYPYKSKRMEDIAIRKYKMDTFKILEEMQANPNGNLLEKVALYYQSCFQSEKINKEQGSAIMRNVLKDFGGFSFAFEEDCKKDISWETRLIKAKFEFRKNLFFRAEIVDKDSTYFQIQEQALSLSIADWERYNKHKKGKVVRYKAFMYSLISLLKGGVHFKESKRLNSTIDQVVNFELGLVKIMIKYKKPEDFTTMEFKQLEKKIPNFPWRRFFNETENNSGGMKKNMIDDLQVNIKENVIRDTINYLRKADCKVISNYIGWRLLELVSEFLGKSFRDILYKYEYLSRNSRTDIHTFCFEHLKKYENEIHVVLSRGFIEKFVTTSMRKHARKVMKNLRRACTERLTQVKWLDEHSLQYLTRKMQYVETILALQNRFMNDKWLKKFYLDIKHPMSRNNFLENHKYFKQAISKPPKKDCSVESHLYRYFSYNLNGHYIVSANSVAVTAGSLVHTFYHPEAVLSLYYGAFGYLGGHEIGHSFFSNYSDYNEFGYAAGRIEGHLISNYSYNIMETKKDCLVYQYGNTTDPLSHVKLNSLKTMNEDMSDNIGMQAAFRAYLLTGEGDVRLSGLEGLSNKKLFFLGTAQKNCHAETEESMKEAIRGHTHSPQNYRVNIPLSNFEAFSTVFNCPKGSPMNPRKKCGI